MKYEWDPKKAASNMNKHGIHFADAVGIFEDDSAITLEDRDAGGEQRFISIGTGFNFMVLVVVYTFRAEETVRIISARKAARNERIIYEKGI